MQSMGPIGLSVLDRRLHRLSDLGDRLEALAQLIDFEIFRPDLEDALRRTDSAKAQPLRYDAVLMFKVLVIQTANNLSYRGTEFLIHDRLSFMRFLGLELADQVPDAQTIWLFRGRLMRAGVIDMLFSRLHHALEVQGYLAVQGQIVDATVMPVPKQRLKRQGRVGTKAASLSGDTTAAAAACGLPWSV
ncbi:MAG: transposase [Alphaproteobacteria bacterium]|nr:MAG: transposase [Alphaproteobacteria bacterium]